MTNRMKLAGVAGAAALLVCGVALAKEPADAGLIGTAALPRDLSPWGMFLGADVVVKSVLIGLVVASVVTWTVWLAKSVELAIARRRARAAAAMLASVRTLDEAAAQARSLKGPAESFVDAASTEVGLSAASPDLNGIKDRIASRLGRIEAACGRRIVRGTGVLATIGATGPFVGLFGTVWGIMNSFIGISKAQTTNLAVVAPGIAEALLATALGLAAAIPAVVIYNVFARSIANYRALLADASSEVLRLAGRDIDMQGVLPAPPARISRLTAAE